MKVEKEKTKKCSHVILYPRSMVRNFTFTINLIGHSSSFSLKFAPFFFLLWIAVVLVLFAVLCSIHFIFK